MWRMLRRPYKLIIQTISKVEEIGSASFETDNNDNNNNNDNYDDDDDNSDKKKKKKKNLYSKLVIIIIIINISSSSLVLHNHSDHPLCIFYSLPSLYKL